MDVLFQITRLKIDSNPFAKGFRDSGRVRLVHDKGDCFCAIFEMSKPPPPAQIGFWWEDINVARLVEPSPYVKLFWVSPCLVYGLIRHKHQE